MRWFQQFGLVLARDLASWFCQFETGWGRSGVLTRQWLGSALGVLQVWETPTTWTSKIGWFKQSETAHFSRLIGTILNLLQPHPRPSVYIWQIYPCLSKSHPVMQAQQVSHTQMIWEGHSSNWRNYCNTNLVLLRLGLSEVAQNLHNLYETTLYW